MLLATASQLNRSAVESVEFDHSMIAGGLSKIQTADNVFGIFSTPTMRERCMVQLQFMKTRSSSAVGQKIDLSFNPDTLRISDMEGDSSPSSSRASDVYNKIQRTSNIGGTSVDTNKTAAGPLDVMSAPWATDADSGQLPVEKKPLTVPVATSANRNALRAIVSREI
jgi:hypothetical protein